MRKKCKKIFAIISVFTLLFSMAFTAHAKEAPVRQKDIVESDAASALKIVGNATAGYFIVPDEWEEETSDDFIVAIDPAGNIMVCAGAEKGEIYGGITAKDMMAASSMMPEMLGIHGCTDVASQMINYKGHDAVSCTAILTEDGVQAHIGMVIYFTEDGYVAVGAGGMSESDFAWALGIMDTYQPGR